MKIKRTEDNPLYLMIDVKPWPEEPLGAYINVLLERRDFETGKFINRVTIRHSDWRMTAATARQWAQALLRAADIAEELERSGDVVLEGE